MKASEEFGEIIDRIDNLDYKSEEFLSQVEMYAKKGFTDREIAFALGLSPQTFCEKKNEHSELCEVLARGRATITAAVRAKFLAMALGGIKTKSTVVRKLKDQDGNLTGEEELQVSESELAPNLQAMSVWLYHHDEEWRKKEVSKVDITTNGKDMVAPPSVNVQVVTNDPDLLELQDKSVTLKQDEDE